MMMMMRGYNSGTGSVLGNRFSYVGRIATRFMEQVAPIPSSYSHEEKEVDEPEEEEEPMMHESHNAWENDDDLLLDLSTSEQPPPQPQLQPTVDATTEFNGDDTTAVPAPPITGTNNHYKVENETSNVATNASGVAKEVEEEGEEENAWGNDDDEMEDLEDRKSVG